MKRIEGPTPNGGAYAIIFYYDEFGNEVEPEKAMVSYANEYAEDGSLICETTFLKKNEIQVENENMKKNLLGEDTIELPIIKS